MQSGRCPDPDFYPLETRNKEDLRLTEEMKQFEEDESRDERFVGAETPKTINTAFGGLKHFLNFFEKRNSKIKEFANLLQQAELSSDLEKLNTEVVPRLITCFQKAVEKFSPKKGFKPLKELFNKKYTSFQEFYGDIMTAYTKGGFLYRSNNNCLLNEKWTDLDTLLPYTFCFCSAFLRPDLTSANSKERNAEALVLLYRGARLDEASILSYNPNIISNFAWNAATSTSRDRIIAEKFMYRKKSDAKKIPVMFVIEVPAGIDSIDAPSMIDVKYFSDYPHEEEVVIAPGSIFKIKDVHKNEGEEGEEVEIHLILMSNVNNMIHRGQIMYGALQAGTSTDTVAKIVSLSGEQLKDAFRHKKGNQLMEELELSCCEFDAEALIELKETLPTIKNLKRLSVVSNSSKDNNHLEVISKSAQKLKLQKLEILDRNLEDKQIIAFARELRHLTSLITLHLNSAECGQITDVGMKSLCSNGLCHLPLLNDLRLNLAGCCEITDDGVKSLGIEGLQHLTLLTTLHLDLKKCDKLTSKGLKVLFSEGLKHLTSLTTLHLSLQDCSQIRDEGIKSLCSQGLQHLKSLVTLHLDLEGCVKITDIGVSTIAWEGLRDLTSLTTLHLNLTRCRQITDGGIDKLCSKGLKYLTSLTTLHLDLTGCCEFTDEGMSILCSRGLQHLVSLTDCYLNLRKCRKITKKALKTLCSQELQRLTSLSTVSLDVHECSKIMADGVRGVNRYAQNSKIPFALNINLLSKTEKLQQYTFKRIFNGQAPDQKKPDLYALSKGLQRMKELLKELAFQQPSRKLKKFSVQKLQQKNLFSTLNLDLEGCDTTNEGVKNLCSQGLQHLNSLTTLSLNLAGCSEITSEGVKTLCCEGLQYLTSLTTLMINFTGCSGITDEEIKLICHEGIRYSNSLTTVQLCFDDCSKVLSTVFEDLKLILEYFGFQEVKKIIL